MRWEDERYIRVYTRDTVDWLALSWEARALFLMILRKVDRAGIIELGRSGARGLAAITYMPADVVTRCLAELLEDGCVEQHGDSIVVPRFIEAQESKKSDQARQQESRLRRRDMVRSGLDPRARATVIYFIQGEDGGPIKIGRADDLAKRIVSLETSRPDRLVVLAAFPGTLRDESELHARFAHLREKGEWFSPGPDLLEFIRSLQPSQTEAVTSRDQSHPVTVTLNHALLSRAVLSRAEDLRAHEAADGPREVPPAPTTTTTTTTAAPSTNEAVLAELRQHPKLRSVATRNTAADIAGIMMSAAIRLEDALEAIRAVAFDLEDGATEAHTRKALRAYLGKAKLHGDKRRAERAAAEPPPKRVIPTPDLLLKPRAASGPSIAAPKGGVPSAFGGGERAARPPRNENASDGQPEADPDRDLARERALAEFAQFMAAEAAEVGT